MGLTVPGLGFPLEGLGLLGLGVGLGFACELGLVLSLLECSRDFIKQALSLGNLLAVVT